MRYLVWCVVTARYVAQDGYCSRFGATPVRRIVIVYPVATSYSGSKDRRCNKVSSLSTAPLARAPSASLHTAGRIQALAYGVTPYEQL
jgi:hypothetical protein